MSTPMQDAIALVERGDVQVISEYITRARRNERWATFFEFMMNNDLGVEYSEHIQDTLNDPRYDKTYLCKLVEDAMRSAQRSEPSQS